MRRARWVLHSVVVSASVACGANLSSSGQRTSGDEPSSNSSAGAAGAGASAGAATSSGPSVTTSGTSATSSVSSGASASSVAHVVRPCTGDAGPLTTGVWENITPAGVAIGPTATKMGNNVTYGIVEVVLDPTDYANVFTAGDDAGMFKSTDCGATWTHINTGANGSILDTGQQWSIAIDPTNPLVMFAANGYGTNPNLFKSVNGGVDWQPLFPTGSIVANAVQLDGFAQEVSMDPTNDQHLLVSFHAPCNAPYNPNCLGETLDSGSTWQIINGPVPPDAGSWFEGASPQIIAGGAMLYATPGDGLFYTGNSGGSWATVATGGNQQMYKRADGTLFLGSAYGLNQSTDNGQTWTPIANSPAACGLVGDGTTMYSVVQFGGSQPLYSATEADPTTWTNMTTPDWSLDGGNYLAFDKDHHILYVSTQQSGLWRLVTE